MPSAISISRRDTANAITNYELAAKHSTRNGVDKAIAQVTLGGLYYDRGRYDKAQPCYAEECRSYLRPIRDMQA